MNVIFVFNGLGNQMSQYALYLMKTTLGQKSICVFKDTAHNGIELQRLFGIKAHHNILYPLFNLLYDVCLTTRYRKIRALVMTILGWLNISLKLENHNYSFQPDVLKRPDGVMLYIGGWHHYRYFCKTEDLIREKYVFPPFRDMHNLSIKKDAQDKSAVAIHIRRGDYMDNVNYELLGKVCDEQYYLRAISYLESEIPNPTFYVFSNDMEWSKKLLDGKETVYIDWNCGKNSWADMALMSEFSNIIISNSTFSWWAAWLGKKDKKVICPPVFIFNDVNSDIYPPEWIRV